MTQRPDRPPGALAADRAAAPVEATGLAATAVAPTRPPPVTSTSCSTAIRRACARTGRASPTTPETSRESSSRTSRPRHRAADPRERRHLQRLRRGRRPARRPWALDVLPLILPAAEWEPLDRRPAPARPTPERDGRRHLRRAAPARRRARSRRARPRASRASCGACHGVDAARRVSSCTRSRSTWRAGPTARWWVVGTRAQAPSGAGYALENRLTVSRLFPDAFRELRVHMLAPFFRGLLRDAARGRAFRRASRRTSCS